MTHLRPSPPLVALLAVALAVPSVRTAADTPSVEERLQRLETELGAVKKENQELRAALGLPGAASAVVVRPAGHEAALSVGGMLQMQADFGDKGDTRFTSGHDRFYLRRARLNLQGRFAENFAFRIEGEFAGSLGESTGYRAQLTDGYIEWSRFDFANLRVGQFKTPFGYEQLYSDPKLLTIERTLANDRLTVSRQIGLQLSGTVADQRFTYAAGVFNGTGTNTNTNTNDNMLWVGRVGAVAWQGKLAGQDARVTVGANAYDTHDTALTGQPAEFGFDATPGGTKDNIFTGHRSAGGLDAQVHLGGLDLWGEYLRERFAPANRIPADRFDAAGWYVQAGYFIVPRIVQAVIKYDAFDPNLSVDADRTRTWTVGANYFLKADDLKVQVDYLSTKTDGGPGTNDKLLMRLQTLF